MSTFIITTVLYNQTLLTQHLMVIRLRVTQSLKCAVIPNIIPKNVTKTEINSKRLRWSFLFLTFKALCNERKSYAKVITIFHGDPCRSFVIFFVQFLVDLCVDIPTRLPLIVYRKMSLVLIYKHLHKKHTLTFRRLFVTVNLRDNKLMSCVPTMSHSVHHHIRVYISLMETGLLEKRFYCIKHTFLFT